MDEPSVEMPELMRDLAWLKERAMHLCRNPTPNGQFELGSIDTTVVIVMKIITGIHLREFEDQLRHQDRAISRLTQPWD